MKSSRIAALCAMGMLSVANAAPVTIYSQNFDALTAGAVLRGQGSPAFLTTATTGLENDLAGTVQAGLGVGGSRAFRVDTDPMSATTFWWQEPGSVALAGKLVRMQYDFDLNPPLSATSTLKSSWSVGLYNPGGSRITGVGITTTGNISYTNAAGTATTFTLGTPIVNSQGFHTLGLTIDFSLPVPVGTVDLDGVILPITAGVVAANGTTLGDTDIVASPSGFDVGVFDNLLVTTDQVPEPTAIGALAFAGIAAIRRRR